MTTEQQSEVDKEMDEALEESILHWKRLAAEPGCEGYGTSSCALCKLLIARHRYLACEHCPVMNTTGLRGCVATPYTSYATAILRKEFYRARQAAADEVQFLESLRRTNHDA